MAQTLSEIMKRLDIVLKKIVWVNPNRDIVSLHDELKIGEGSIKSIEDLPRESLIGAYVAIQVYLDDFSIAAETLETKDLARIVKEQVFQMVKDLR